MIKQVLHKKVMHLRVEMLIFVWIVLLGRPGQCQFFRLEDQTFDESNDSWSRSVCNMLPGSELLMVTEGSNGTEVRLGVYGSSAQTFVQLNSSHLDQSEDVPTVKDGLAVTWISRLTDLLQPGLDLEFFDSSFFLSSVFMDKIDNFLRQDGLTPQTRDVSASMSTLSRGVVGTVQTANTADTTDDDATWPQILKHALNASVRTVTNIANKLHAIGTPKQSKMCFVPSKSSEPVWNGNITYLVAWIEQSDESEESEESDETALQLRVQVFEEYRDLPQTLQSFKASETSESFVKGVTHLHGLLGMNGIDSENICSQLYVLLYSVAGDGMYLGVWQVFQSFQDRLDVRQKQIKQVLQENNVINVTNITNCQINRLHKRQSKKHPEILIVCENEANIVLRTYYFENEVLHASDEWKTLQTPGNATISCVAAYDTDGTNETNETDATDAIIVVYRNEKDGKDNLYDIYVQKYMIQEMIDVADVPTQNASMTSSTQPTKTMTETTQYLHLSHESLLNSNNDKIVVLGESFDQNNFIIIVSAGGGGICCCICVIIACICRRRRKANASRHTGGVQLTNRSGTTTNVIAKTPTADESHDTDFNLRNINNGNVGLEKLTSLSPEPKNISYASSPEASNNGNSDDGDDDDLEPDIADEADGPRIEAMTRPQPVGAAGDPKQTSEATGEGSGNVTGPASPPAAGANAASLPSQNSLASPENEEEQLPDLSAPKTDKQIAINPNPANAANAVQPPQPAQAAQAVPQPNLASNPSESVKIIKIDASGQPNQAGAQAPSHNITASLLSRMSAGDLAAEAAAAQARNDSISSVTYRQGSARSTTTTTTSAKLVDLGSIHSPPNNFMIPKQSPRSQMSPNSKGIGLRSDSRVLWNTRMASTGAYPVVGSIGSSGVGSYRSYASSNATGGIASERGRMTVSSMSRASDATMTSMNISNMPDVPDDPRDSTQMRTTAAESISGLPELPDSLRQSDQTILMAQDDESTFAKYGMGRNSRNDDNVDINAVLGMGMDAEQANVGMGDRDETFDMLYRQTGDSVIIPPNGNDDQGAYAD